MLGLQACSTIAGFSIFKQRSLEIIYISLSHYISIVCYHTDNKISLQMYVQCFSWESHRNSSVMETHLYTVGLFQSRLGHRVRDSSTGALRGSRATSLLQGEPHPAVPSLYYLSPL
jgi:hypothetical protein